MNRLKLYEEFNTSLKEDDIVVFNIGKSPYDKKSISDQRFTDGELCKITIVDLDAYFYPYYIVSLSSGVYSWVNNYQIRKAEPHEIDANKYNL